MHNMKIALLPFFLTILRIPVTRAAVCDCVSGKYQVGNADITLHWNEFTCTTSNSFTWTGNSDGSGSTTTLVNGDGADPYCEGIANKGGEFPIYWYINDECYWLGSNKDDAFNRNIWCKFAELYDDTTAILDTTILDTTILDTTALDTTTSDCGILAIDNFLLQCSNEFESHSNTLTTLDASIYANSDLIGINTVSITTINSGLTTLGASIDANSGLIGTNTASITTLSSEVTTNADDITVIEGEVAGISSLSDAISNAESSLSETNLRIDAFASFAAGAGPGLNVLSGGSNLSLKDIIIIALLVFNIISITVSVYICYNMNKGKKIHNFKNVDCETDDEENGLRS